MTKCKVLIVGGTGYIGKKIVKASLNEGHETYVLHRTDANFDIEKVMLLLSFKQQGVHLVEGSFDDYKSLLDAVKLVDVVICTISGVVHRSHHILKQLLLVQAIKEAGCIKRFLPSEFGMDPPRMGHALEPGSITFREKMQVRKAIEDANVPYTYVSANCFGAFHAGNLGQFGTLWPPTDKVYIHGNGNVKAEIGVHVDMVASIVAALVFAAPELELSPSEGRIEPYASGKEDNRFLIKDSLLTFVDEDDVATYTMKSISDPRTLNKTIFLRPPENVLTQLQLVDKWENLIGKKLEKEFIAEKNFLASLKGMDYGQQAGGGHYYSIFYVGDTANFEIGEDGVEASELYPEVHYIRMDEYLKRYV